ncbi:MAG: hypothetical protein ACTSVV_08630 [Promethearchaeota archaeon]
MACCMRPLSEKIKKYYKTLEWNPKMTINAVTRDIRIHELLSKYKGKINLEVMEKIAREHGEGESRNKSIWQNGFNAVTIGSNVASPQEHKIWLSHDGPCKTKYTPFDLF